MKNDFWIGCNERSPMMQKNGNITEYRYIYMRQTLNV